MSNRDRVDCASYIVHDLNIDWTCGAAYFESKLMDHHQFELDELGYAGF